MKRAAAEHALSAMIECGQTLVTSLGLVGETGSKADFLAYRETISKLLVDMLIEVMNPIFAEYPDLIPAEMRQPPVRKRARVRATRSRPARVRKTPAKAK